MSDQLTILIISYNSAAVIEECMTGLLRSGTFKVMIIDNASPDGSASRLQKKFPDIEIIEEEQNIGYGRAANIGLRKTETPYALLLNPDLKAGLSDVEQLLRHATTDCSNTAIWGPAVKQKDFTGEPPQKVEWLSGCAMLFDVKKISEVGLFDENFFLFFEETDLCYRAVRSGFGIRLCKDVFFQHLVGQASPSNPKVEYLKNWHYGWSRSYFLTKHGLATGKKSPGRRYWTYRLKSLISVSPGKRQGYGARADGVCAFIRQVKAFASNGAPAQPGS